MFLEAFNFFLLNCLLFFIHPQLYEAFSFLKQLGAVVLVHAENGDLIFEVNTSFCLSIYVNSHLVETDAH